MRREIRYAAGAMQEEGVLKFQADHRQEALAPHPAVALAATGLLASTPEHDGSLEPAIAEGGPILNELAASSRAAYRALVHDDGTLAPCCPRDRADELPGGACVQPADVGQAQLDRRRQLAVALLALRPPAHVGRGARCLGPGGRGRAPVRAAGRRAARPGGRADDAGRRLAGRRRGRRAGGCALGQRRLRAA